MALCLLIRAVPPVNKMASTSPGASLWAPDVSHWARKGNWRVLVRGPAVQARQTGLGGPWTSASTDKQASVCGQGLVLQVLGPRSLWHAGLPRTPTVTFPACARTQTGIPATELCVLYQ
ncbi:hypothetical protein DPEC_G00328160 [Dallia pectoralis]|uniref:Uncharacterized protein n=1 Tax=Dallia pectoralis TaxID=75939 RepID=A0ACC2F8M8_DALPE|nr:hypothetical protein DPEC_G00328160 [Dallia pectoralis]